MKLKPRTKATQLLCLTIALMCFLSNLNTSTHAANEEIPGKRKCPPILLMRCLSLDVKCCKTADCEKGEVCCQTFCSYECLKEDPENIASREINPSDMGCKEYNKTDSLNN
ncbi:hypothetical protein TNCT_49971 [Trichonephila clavata]|uniref:Uncharacterized protein n=1 Tax=Trichonephila clavata TaxID=2740835 RepID=A0A8X6ICD1_TRICU|nr:hypothetical protein TNCT_49971 [Trichonephila clavata]